MAHWNRPHVCHANGAAGAGAALDEGVLGAVAAGAEPVVVGDDGDEGGVVVPVVAGGAALTVTSEL